MSTVALVVGTRPNFMKVDPVLRALRNATDIRPVLIHSGQHYGQLMSDVFFEQLGTPAPDVELHVGSGTHAEQTAHMLMGFERAFTDLKPDWVLVPGDVNSTLAAALAAVKLGIPVAHLEAGLRSFDRTMPEEINRILTDHMASLHLTPSIDADVNLDREGVGSASVHLVGNAMIDSLSRLLPAAQDRLEWLRRDLRLPSDYVLCTFHRPGNVDDEASLRAITEALRELSEDIPILFPIHPRTRRNIAALVGPAERPGLLLSEPLSYLDFIGLESSASLVLTDSGGVQEETTYLGVPCLTVRPNTERPVTITHGTNALVETDRGAIVSAARKKLSDGRRADTVQPHLWDGQTGERVAQIFEKVMT